MQAAQALEPAALVPLQLLAPGGHIVLVGDPKQLPPTVLSRAAESSNLAQSLFERLQQVVMVLTHTKLQEQPLECYNKVYKKDCSCFSYLGFHRACVMQKIWAIWRSPSN